MKINIKPLSVNQAWQGKRFKTPAYKSYENEIAMKLPNLKIDPEEHLKLNITFGYSNKSADIDNSLKPFLDCLQKKYGFNDNKIYELIVRKEIVKKGDEFINFAIIVMP